MKNLFLVLSLITVIVGVTAAFTFNFVLGSIVLIIGGIMFLFTVTPKPDKSKCTCRFTGHNE